MPSNRPPSANDAADIVAISQLVLVERESRDLGLWNSMAECFHPDSRVHLSWINGTGDDFVKGSIDMAERGMKAKHRLGPPLVRLAGNRAVASFMAIIDIPDTVKGVEVQLSSHARFLYRVEKRDDRWGICFFDSIYVRDEIVPQIPGERVMISPEEVSGYRKSYRMLCYLLSQTGYVPNQDLAGDDMPETVTAKLAEIYGWAGVTLDQRP